MNASAASRLHKRPSILFFADDPRHDTIRALGNEQIVTPTMDSFVREGTAFTICTITACAFPWF